MLDTGPIDRDTLDSRLEDLLDVLAAERFSIGARERITAHQLMARLALDTDVKPWDDHARAMLSPLLARSEAQGQRLKTLYPSFFPAPVDPKPTFAPDIIGPDRTGTDNRPAPDERPRSRLRRLQLSADGWQWAGVIAACALTIVVAGVFAYRHWAAPADIKPITTTNDKGPTKPVVTAPASPQQPTVRTTKLDAGQLFLSMQQLAPNSAPTLRELYDAGWPSKDDGGMPAPSLGVADSGVSRNFGPVRRNALRLAVPFAGVPCRMPLLAPRGSSAAPTRGFHRCPFFVPAVGCS